MELDYDRMNYMTYVLWKNYSFVVFRTILDLPLRTTGVKLLQPDLEPVGRIGRLNALSNNPLLTLNDVASELCVFLCSNWVTSRELFRAFVCNQFDFLSV